MKFKVDENLPTELKETLSEAGHDAVTVLEEKVSGVPDEDLAVFLEQRRLYRAGAFGTE